MDRPSQGEGKETFADDGRKSLLQGRPSVPRREPPAGTHQGASTASYMKLCLHQASAVRLMTTQDKESSCYSVALFV